MLAPMTTYSSLPSGEIAPEELDYLARRAAGGFGAIITAACCVHPSGWSFEGQWQCSDDRFIPSLASAADIIRQHGSQSILQIHHGGRQAPSALCGTPVSASAVAADRPNAQVPRELTETQILELIESYAQACVRAQAAGFDGVEIHGANTYLIQQFVSPHSNRRMDRWGEDRNLFSREVVQACRNAAPALAIGYRFSPEEIENPGISIVETQALLNDLCTLDLDYLHISLRDGLMSSLRGEFDEPVTQKVCQTIARRIPLVSSGQLHDPDRVLAAFELGAEAIAIGRAAISDPDVVLHLQRGEQVCTKVPYGDFRSQLVVPPGLARRIDSVYGWFERG